jgi:hypothetical protein
MQGHVKLSDFGIVTELKNTLEMAASYVGTQLYMRFVQISVIQRISGLGAHAA